VEDSKSTPNNTEYNRKLMLLSCQKSELITVADLIKKGVDPNYIDNNGQLALQVAIENQNLLLLRLLLRSPLIDVNIRFSSAQCTPLIFASKQKHAARLDMVKVICQSNTNLDVNALDKNGRSALTYGSFYGDYDLVKYLIDAGAAVNPHISNINSISPLIFAKRYNHARVITLLLQHGAQDIDSGGSLSQSTSSSGPARPKDDWMEVPTSQSTSSSPNSSLLSSVDISELIKTNPIPGNVASRVQKYRTSPAPPPRHPSNTKPPLPAVSLASTLEERPSNTKNDQNKRRNVSHTLHLVVDED